MKTKVILAFVAAGALALSACTKKIDEKTMADINQFGTDWTTLGEQATAWAGDLQTATSEAQDFAAKQKSTLESLAASKDQALKDQANTMTEQANADAGTLQNMMNEYTSFRTSWDENTKAFGEWKDKIAKGEITPEDAIKGLADWKAKMTDAQTQITNWTAAFSSAKDSYTKNMAAATEMETAMTAKKK